MVRCSQLAKAIERVLAAALLAAVSMPLHAAENSGGAAELEEIVVTATKRSSDVMDVPISIQAISGDKLVAKGVTSVSDIVQIIPGASQTFKASPGFEVLQVRGISSGAIGDSLVGYYIDEIPFSLPNTQYIPPVNVFDLARVEVLRGPQGTLYGQSTMGGAIRLITNNPDLEKFGGEVRMGYGSVDGGYDGYKVDAMLNAPIVKDKFGIRLTGGTSNEESFIKNTGDVDTDNVRLKALWQATEDLSIEATAWGIRVDQVDYWYGSPSAPYVGITDPNEPRGVNTDVGLGNVTIRWSTGIGDLVSATSYMDHQLDYVFALPGLRDLFPGAGQWLSDNAISTQLFSQEIRLASKEDAGWLDWIGGVFYQDGQLEATQEQGWVNYKPFNLGPSVYTEGVATLETQSIGVFGELSTELLGGKLIPTVGLRYFRDERTVDDLRDGVTTDGDRTYESWNPRFNLAFRPTDGAMYYVNVAKGFRSGAQQSQASADAANAAGLPADILMPEDSLWSYELGAKWNIGGTIAVEVAVYKIDWQDAQITNLLVGANNVTTTIISGGNDVDGKGVDFSFNWATPLAGLTFQLAGNLNETEFTRTPAGTTATVGDQIPGSPPKSLTTALYYKTMLGSLNFNSNLSYSYRDEQTEMTTGWASDTIEDLRLRVGVGGERWDASVYGTNLSNQRGVAAVLSALVVNPIQPRKVGVDVNFRF